MLEIEQVTALGQVFEQGDDVFQRLAVYAALVDKADFLQEILDDDSTVIGTHKVAPRCYTDRL